ncbi:hypothetical protein FOL47_005688, partial [Perkinsus chesapeaki]
MHFVLITSSLTAVFTAGARHRSKAEIDWDKSQKDTDELVAKVNAEMKVLGNDLDRTAKQDRKDLALLEQSRRSEDMTLEETEESLRRLAKQESKDDAIPFSSFFQSHNNNDTAIPVSGPPASSTTGGSLLESGINKAKEWASSMVDSVKAAGASFLQIHNDDSIEANSEKAQQSINVAQEALSKLNVDLANQQRVLESEQKEFAKSSETRPTLSFEGHEAAGVAPLDFGDSVGASFLQTGEAKGPITPDMLQEWYAKFEDSLSKVRADAGLPDIPRSSFLQKGINFASMAANEKVKKDQRD